jgi:hypothetical protein
MKSITRIRKRKREKLRLKPYVMLEFLALYTEEINQFIFQQKQKCSKTWFTPQTLTQLDCNGKSFDAILQDIQVHPVTDNFTYWLLSNFDDKEITIEVPVKSLVTLKELWPVEIYV